MYYFLNRYKQLYIFTNHGNCLKKKVKKFCFLISYDVYTRQFCLFAK